MKKSFSNGFTLMEVLVVVGIVAILSAIAIPLYQNYTVRSQVAEGFAVAEAEKAAIEEFYSLRGRLPENADEAGINEAYKTDLVRYNTWHQGGWDNSGKFVKSPLAGYFNVQMDLSGLEKGLSAFYLEAHVTGSEITWRCVSPLYRNVSSKSAVPLKYLPSVCKGEGVALPAVALATASAQPTQGPATGQPKPQSQTGQAPAQASNTAAGQQSTKACAANEDKVSLTINGLSFDACIKKCPAGQQRDPANPINCNAPPQPQAGSQQAGSQTSCPPTARPTPDGSCANVCNAGLMWSGNSYVGSCVPDPSYKAPAVSCNADEEQVTLMVNGVATASCASKCPAGQHRDVTHPTQCLADVPAHTSPHTCPDGLVMGNDGKCHTFNGPSTTTGGTTTGGTTTGGPTPTQLPAATQTDQGCVHHGHGHAYGLCGGHNNQHGSHH